MTAAHPSDEQLTGGQAVLRMRDEFLALVTAYNAIGEYSEAMDAQAMAVALNKFEEEHNLTNIVWPPRVASEGDGGAFLVEVK